MKTLKVKNGDCTYIQIIRRYKLIDGDVYTIHILIHCQYRCNIYNKCGAILNANSYGRNCDFLDSHNVEPNVDVSPI